MFSMMVFVVYWVSAVVSVVLKRSAIVVVSAILEHSSHDCSSALIRLLIDMSAVLNSCITASIFSMMLPGFVLLLRCGGG